NPRRLISSPIYRRWILSLSHLRRPTHTVSILKLCLHFFELSSSSHEILCAARSKLNCSLQCSHKISVSLLEQCRKKLVVISVVRRDPVETRFSRQYQRRFSNV